MGQCFLFILCLLAYNVVVKAQETVDVRGLVLDEHNKPVPYANIRTKQLTAGTISNEDGRFLLRIPHTSLQDTLVLSAVGYQSYVIPASNVSVTREESFQLQTATVLLNEVVVTPLTALQIIQKALDKIPDNYAHQPLMMKGFYREGIEQNGQLISLAEALISIYKAPYTDPADVDQMKLIKGRRKQDVKESDLLKHLTISGGLRVDFVKYGIHFLVDQNFNLYDYTLKESFTAPEQDTVFVIEFDQKADVKLPLLKGKIYIDQETYAFSGVEYGYSPKGIKYLNQYDRQQRKDMKKVGMYLESRHALTKVNFCRLHDTWYLQYAHSEYQAEVTNKNKQKSMVWYSADLLITEIDKQHVRPIPKEEALITFGVDMGKQIGSTYDVEFWEHHNYIMPSEGTKAKARILLQH